VILEAAPVFAVAAAAIVVLVVVLVESMALRETTSLLRQSHA
jgi:hypothetical protein